MRRWLEVCGVKTLYVEPDAPSWEDAYAEPFVGRFGDQLLK